MLEIWRTNGGQKIDVSIVKTIRNADGSEVAGNERIAPEKGQTASFSRTWSVSDSTNGDGETTLDWAVRGAIALDIGPTTFDSAEYGTYRSAVTVTLTTP